MLKRGTFISTIIISLFLLNSLAHAYVVRVTNGTNETIAFDINGVGVYGGSMMQGKIHKILFPNEKIWSKKVAQSTTYYKNAGAVPLRNFSPMNKPLIKPGHTTVLEFTDVDFGICFDFSNVAVGLKSKGYSMRAREIKFADSKEFGNVMDSVEGMGTDISSIGEGVGQLGGKAKAVGAALQGIGGLWGKISSAAKGSGCRNISLVVVKTDIAGTTETGLKIGEKLGVFVLR